MRQRTWLFTVLAVCLGMGLCPAGGDDYNGGPPPGPSSNPIFPRNSQDWPSPPSQPGSPSRPSSWPGGAPALSPDALRARLGNALAPPMSEQTPCEGGQLLGRCGSETVLSGDLFGGIYDLFDRWLDNKLPPEKLELQRKEVAREIKEAVDDLAAHSNERNPLAGVTPEHQALLRNLLKGHLETLMIYNDARATIPAENFEHVDEGLTKDFEQLQVKRLMKIAHVQSRDELDRKLRSFGSSLEREKQAFMRRALAMQWLSEKVKADEEITHQELLEWYRGHLHSFDKPARARWDELMVRGDKYPNRAAAYAAIVQMGNQVALGGRPLAEVARAQSDGLTAAAGGLRDWTTQGSLASQELDRALFTQTVGQLSPTILETTNGFHIIRVLERQQATRTSFPEAQDDIRKRIKQERSAKKAEQYLADVQRLYPPWTIFDAAAASRTETARRQEPPRNEPSRY